MGYMRHHAIVVSSYNKQTLEKAHKQAIEHFGPLVSTVIPSLINTYVSFFIAPDGSKEGWDESDSYDTKRSAFTEWLNRQRFSDGSTSLRWVEVQYGDDEYVTKIIRHSDEIIPSNDYSGPTELEDK